MKSVSVSPGDSCGSWRRMAIAVESSASCPPDESRRDRQVAKEEEPGIARLLDRTQQLPQHEAGEKHADGNDATLREGRVAQRYQVQRPERDTRADGEVRRRCGGDRKRDRDWLHLPRLRGVRTVGQDPGPLEL